MSLRTFGLLLLLPLASLRADVIYSNFGVDDTYSTGAGMIVMNDGMAWSSVAIQFIPAENYNLTSIEFVASDIMAGDPGVTLGIFADNNGQPGGPAIESFRVSGPFGAFGTIVSVTNVTSALQPLLLADTPYWIGMQGPVGGFVIWNQNVIGAEGYSSSDGLGQWSTSAPDQGVVEIDGTVNNDVPPPPPPPIVDTSAQSTPLVPEPSSIGLVLIGLVAMLALRRRGTATR